MPYQSTLFLANLESLKDRQIKLNQFFFKKILSINSCKLPSGVCGGAPADIEFGAF